VYDRIGGISRPLRSPEINPVYIGNPREPSARYFSYPLATGGAKTQAKWVLGFCRL
jgi:hypothetical protein